VYCDGAVMGGVFCCPLHASGTTEHDPVNEIPGPLTVQMTAFDDVHVTVDV
jgi:hypothetical protein